jgi:hypothetical protein
MNEPADQTMARPHLMAAQRYYAEFMMDVLVYTVVLNLFVEFVDSIVIDSFLVSLLTAVVIKVMIDLIGTVALADRGRVRMVLDPMTNQIAASRPWSHSILLFPYRVVSWNTSPKSSSTTRNNGAARSRNLAEIERWRSISDIFGELDGDSTRQRPNTRARYEPHPIRQRNSALEVAS